MSELFYLSYSFLFELSLSLLAKSTPKSKRCFHHSGYSTYILYMSDTFLLHRFCCLFNSYPFH